MNNTNIKQKTQLKNTQNFNLILVLGNQLFNPKIFKQYKVDPKNSIFFMKEDKELASYFKFHKHKIIFFFAAMRSYRDELISYGYNVHYETLHGASEELKFNNYESSLERIINKFKINSVFGFEIEDKFFEGRIINFFKNKKISLSIWQSPMFLTSRSEFQVYLQSTHRPFMKTFYEYQRRKHEILIEGNKPVGGAWSFDNENRMALPKNIKTPTLPKLELTKGIKEVSKLVDQEFSLHPGNSLDYWLPTDRKTARQWFHTFLKDRLEKFGPYEDAIPPHSEFVFHSVLTPFLNSGLLTPDEVVKETLAFGLKNKIPLASLEGFIRQVIGWREFIRGIYQNFSQKQETTNFWNHNNKLSPLWYKGDTGIPPLDETLRRVIKRGYAHHIERLMIIGSLMLLLEVHPSEAHRWFMEMFVDSSDWVMGPNVYGMALFSDGGVFATKPYICGSNYLRKMGGYKKEDWCDGVDGLYWEFIKKHENFFLKNPRLSMMVKSSQKISKQRWEVLSSAATNLRQKLVVSL
ncbi:MAG: cryptochrome/photolyase family protein [Bdellovibrionaceae bacterium]|nr:cryptochrome/photolyase family protein [Pseudobdellovibrionaceae bacterium]NUM59770.1 cryptochrome/photolyase family protein [Pseudobdellovibrionaceae bacterium]